jgi:hypothetical protein
MEDVRMLNQAMALASSSQSPDVLTELSRATTAYHEALPDRAELARQEYEEALRKFKAMHATE